MSSIPLYYSGMELIKTTFFFSFLRFENVKLRLNTIRLPLRALGATNGRKCFNFPSVFFVEER